MAHYITSLTFGEMLDKKNLPGNFNPLARRDRSQADPAESHDYTMKIVPTIYEDSAGNTLVSYQYTYAYSVSLIESVKNLFPFNDSECFCHNRITFRFLLAAVHLQLFGFATIWTQSPWNITKGVNRFTLFWLR